MSNFLSPILSIALILWASGILQIELLASKLLNDYPIDGNLIRILPYILAGGVIITLMDIYKSLNKNESKVHIILIFIYTFLCIYAILISLYPITRGYIAGVSVAYSICIVGVIFYSTLEILKRIYGVFLNLKYNSKLRILDILVIIIFLLVVLGSNNIWIDYCKKNQLEFYYFYLWISAIFGSVVFFTHRISNHKSLLLKKYKKLDMMSSDLSKIEVDNVFKDPDVASIINGWKEVQHNPSWTEMKMLVNKIVHVRNKENLHAGNLQRIKQYKEKSQSDSGEIIVILPAKTQISKILEGRIILKGSIFSLVIIKSSSQKKKIPLFLINLLIKNWRVKDDFYDKIENKKEFIEKLLASEFIKQSSSSEEPSQDIEMSDILDKDDKGIFLFSFCQAGNIQKVKEFIEYYPYFKIDSFNESTGYNPLLISVAEGHEEIVQYPLLKGANPNVYTIANNASSLGIASQYGFLSIIKIFVFYGANINIKDDEGSTPLFRAAKFGHEEIVQYLLANGADPNLLSNDGSSAYDWAKSRNEGEIMRILRQASKSSLPY